MAEADKKLCFIICPIGHENSDIRRNSDEVFEEILEPSLGHMFKCVRADHVDRTGYITTKIVQLILDADLVVADLSTHNPNVLYELAIRHSFGKPFIQIIEKSEDLPFDIGGIETVKYSLNVRDVAIARKRIRTQADSIDWSADVHANPVTIAFNLEKIATAPKANLDALVNHLTKISDQLDALNDNITFDVERQIESIEIEMDDNLKKAKEDILQHMKYYSTLLEGKISKAKPDKKQTNAKPSKKT